MAYQDALFQLGMDLTRSSTAQKEDFGETARVAHDLGTVSERRHATRKISVPQRERSRSIGRSTGNHLIIDLFGASGLTDLGHIEQALKACARVGGGEPLHVHLHRFTPNGGVSGVVVLADSHISFHSWPEAGYAALDVFMRGKSQTLECVEQLKAAFSPHRIEVKTQRRDGSTRATTSQAAAETLAIAQGETATRVARQRSRVHRAA